MQEQEFIISVSSLHCTALRIGQQFFGNTGEAEDVAQETMMRLWAARDGIDATCPLEPLVIRIAKNVCVSMRRKRTAIVTAHDPLESTAVNALDCEPSPQVLLEERENAVWLEHRMKRLPGYLYRVLRMKQQEQLSDQQIADIIGTDKRSVQTLVSKARHKLLNDLKQRHFNENE